MKTCINILLFALYIYTFVTTLYSDLKYSIVRNKSLGIVAILALLLDFLYVYTWEFSDVKLLLFNFILVVVSSVLLYVLHVWAGGDAKLFIVEFMLLPPWLYMFDNNVVMRIMIYSFSLAFIYIIGESVVASLRHHEMFAKYISKNNIMIMFINWGTIALMSIDLQRILRFVLKDVYSELYLTLVFFNICFILLLRKQCVKIKMSYKITVIIILAVLSALLLSYLHEQIAIDIRNCFIITFVFVLREWADRYSYRTIKVEELEKGMVLSSSTAMLFVNSRVKNLPIKKSTEDMASRLNEEEVLSVRRWAKSKNGSDNIVIVRKIPFAVFINIGYMLYIIYGGSRFW